MAGVRALLVHDSLLQMQRELYDMPRGRDRFLEYLKTLDEGSGGVRVPLVGFNPMGKQHAADRLDAWLAIDADRLAGEAIADVESRLDGRTPDRRVGVVLADDHAGGWTDRALIEAHSGFLAEVDIDAKYGWLTVTLWTSDDPDPRIVTQSVLATVYRNLYRQRHGKPECLSDWMMQEGLALKFSAASEPSLEPDDLAYSRDVLEPYRASTDFPVCFSGMYGDRLAKEKGYAPLGLSDHAAFAVARHDVSQMAVDPVSRLLDD